MFGFWLMSIHHIDQRLYLSSNVLFFIMCWTNYNQIILPRLPKQQFREKKEEIARLETIDCGKPIDEAEWDLVR